MIRPTTRLAVLLVLTSGCAMALSGPIDPPAGPVQSTMKTLDQIEPRTPITLQTCPGDSDSVFRITSPGSYMLTGNLEVPSGKSGIEIASDGVTIDLGGFTISGLQGSGAGITSANAARSRITIRNGQIHGLGSYGVSLTESGFDGSQPMEHRLERLAVSDCFSGVSCYAGVITDCQSNNNTWSGFYVYGTAPSIVERCVASGNGSSGIYVWNGVITDCAARSNGSDGISIGDSGVIRDCHSEGNKYGFSVRDCTITGCTASENTSMGILVNARGTVRDNYIVSTTLRAGSIGIKMNSDACQIENNNIVTQETGILTTSSLNLIVSNSFRYCTKAMNVAAGNRVGTLLIGTSSGAINGNSGGGLGTSDPKANIIY